MKQIQAVSIWDKGTNQSAEILNAYGTNTTLGVSADFYYMLYTKDNVLLVTGSVKMDGEDYQKWSNDDEYAWEWIAGQLNLVIVGDWVEPIIEPTVKESLTTEILNPETDTKI